MTHKTWGSLTPGKLGSCHADGMLRAAAEQSAMSSSRQNPHLYISVTERGSTKILVCFKDGKRVKIK